MPYPNLPLFLCEILSTDAPVVLVLPHSTHDMTTSHSCPTFSACCLSFCNSWRCLSLVDEPGNETVVKPQLILCLLWPFEVGQHDSIVTSCAKLCWGVLSTTCIVHVRMCMFVCAHVCVHVCVYHISLMRFLQFFCCLFLCSYYLRVAFIHLEARRHQRQLNTAGVIRSGTPGQTLDFSAAS